MNALCHSKTQYNTLHTQQYFACNAKFFEMKDSECKLKQDL